MGDSSSSLYLMLGHVVQLNWLRFWTRASFRLLCISSLIYLASFPIFLYFTAIDY